MKGSPCELSGEMPWDLRGAMPGKRSGGWDPECWGSDVSWTGWKLPSTGRTSGRGGGAIKLPTTTADGRLERCWRCGLHFGKRA
jgi:hypothetical protein